MKTRRSLKELLQFLVNPRTREVALFCQGYSLLRRITSEYIYGYVDVGGQYRGCVAL